MSSGSEAFKVAAMNTFKMYLLNYHAGKQDFSTENEPMHIVTFVGPIHKGKSNAQSLVIYSNQSPISFHYSDSR